MIEEPPLLTIRRRPTSATIPSALREAPTGWLVDAMQGRGAMDAAIKPIVPEAPGMRRFVGTALTCWCGPNDNLALMAAISLAEQGDVIVVASEGFGGAGMRRRSGGWHGPQPRGSGDRDRRHGPRPRGDAAVGLPVFARGVTPNSCVRSGPGTVGLPM